MTNEGRVVLVTASQEHLVIARTLMVLTKSFYYQAMLARRQRYIDDLGIDDFERPMFFIADACSEVASEADRSGTASSSSWFAITAACSCLPPDRFRS